jgi:hypothetical protein
MRPARSIWSRRRHNLAKARRPESVTAAVDPPLSVRQGKGLASRARTRPGGIIALAGATGAFDRPAPALGEPGRRRSPGPSGLEDSARGVAQGSGDRDRSGGEPAGPRPHFSMQCRCISCGFRAGAVDFSQRNGAPTRFNNRENPDVAPHSEREAARADWPSITLTALAGVCTKPPAGAASRGRQPLTATQRVAHSAEAKRHQLPGRRLGSTGGRCAGARDRHRLANNLVRG